MSAFSKLVGMLCFAGIVAYWYFLPYQSYLALNNARNILGPVAANLAVLIILAIVGVPITFGCIIVGFMFMFVGEG